LHNISSNDLKSTELTKFIALIATAYLTGDSAVGRYPNIGTTELPHQVTGSSSTPMEVKAFRKMFVEKVEKARLGANSNQDVHPTLMEELLQQELLQDLDYSLQPPPPLPKRPMDMGL